MCSAAEWGSPWIRYEVAIASLTEHLVLAPVGGEYQQAGLNVHGPPGIEIPG